VFLRDGFHLWAFVAPSLWLLVYRQWLALLAYLVVTTAIVGGLALSGMPTAAVVAVGLCISLLIGFEAVSIRRWTFRRRGWTTLGFVVGEDRDAAEQRFFARWAERGSTPVAEPSTPPNPPSRPAPLHGRDVIGLFPEPGGTR
jgi:hypothetical protein